MSDEQQPLFWVDPRPPDSYGLDYTGHNCYRGEHELCPGYWGDSFRPGKGTRCACLCHERQEGATGGDA